MHSLAFLLSKFANIQLVYVAPESLEMPLEIKESIARESSIEQVLLIISFIHFNLFAGNNSTTPFLSLSLMLQIENMSLEEVRLFSKD